jgi:hypothetical protein
MPYDFNAPAPAPEASPAIPTTPALVEHVEAIAAGESAAVAGAAESVPSRAEAEIEAWFVEHVMNSPVSRAGAEIYNHVRAAVDALKTRLAAL